MLIKRKDNIFGDNIGYLEYYDFSKSNMSDYTRLDTITLIASICYQSSKSHRSKSLYNRLLAESGGLPSSSFEFVPVLIKLDYAKEKYGDLLTESNILKYGEIAEDYLLTNFRAVVYDFENLGIDMRDHFNTKEECNIIAKYFKVFKLKVDMTTFGQAVRHRVNWQVLSRRYVSEKKVPFDFYISEKMKDITSNAGNTQKILDICLEHYKAALSAGIKPEVARGIIPQCAYTVAWCAMQPKQFNSFINLRTDSHAQWSIQQVANAMKELSNTQE